MDSCVNDLATVTSGVVTCLFILSEILPYISKVKGNGITQVISDILLVYINKNKKSIQDEEQQIQ